LFVLGSLAKEGPMHGHQIRRAAQVDRTELWTDIKPGSLYGALHRMAADGVVEVVRTEQEGNMPPRTVYGITPAGREELAEHRATALRRVRLTPDPVDLALQYIDDLDEDELRAVLTARRDEIAAQLDSWNELHAQALPYLTGLEPMTFEHTLYRLRAELAWHNEFLDRLPELLKGRR
jgi:DNA-binding PadR family transcriptional regulator